MLPLAFCGCSAGNNNWISDGSITCFSLLNKIFYIVVNFID